MQAARQTGVKPVPQKMKNNVYVTTLRESGDSYLRRGVVDHSDGKKCGHLERPGSYLQKYEAGTAFYGTGQPVSR